MDKLQAIVSAFKEIIRLADIMKNDITDIGSATIYEEPDISRKREILATL